MYIYIDDERRRALGALQDASGTYEFDAEMTLRQGCMSYGALRAAVNGRALQHRKSFSLFYSVCRKLASGIVNWCEQSLFNTAIRLAQFNVDLGEDEDGEIYSHVHCRIKSFDFHLP